MDDELSLGMLEDALYEPWRKRLASEKKIFIPDGIVNPAKWINAKVRVLFFLKEVNGGDDEWDERDYLRRYNIEEKYKKTHSQTISELTRWIHVFTEDNYPKWNDVIAQTDNTELQSELLQQIAVVNVKKVPGGGTVNNVKFDQYWSNEENIKKLKEQLEIYFSIAPPDFIVCGATAWCYKAVFKEEKLKWNMTSRGVYFCEHGNSVVIDFCHPQARISSNIKYYALLDAVQEIRVHRKKEH